MPAVALPEWHSLFGLLGSAAATLIGAMFVVASLGRGLLTPERSAATRVFLTATVAHLSAVLFSSTVMLVPALDIESLGMAMGLGGLAGLVYSGGILLRIGRHEVDRADKVWYAVLPFAGYGVMVGAAAVTLSHPSADLRLLALGLGLLLAVAIRNSWDMIVFLVARPRTEG
ncbi:MAG TPA: hypothetical protein VHU15_16450 [Stellaceae bacterium]|nr:hypothetical protein [Stellaceae bacterium]